MKTRHDEHPRRVNPAQQVAEWEQHEARKRAEAKRLTWEDLPDKWRGDYCEQGKRRSGGEVRGHADPGNYTMEQIQEFEKRCACPLHLDEDVPGIPYAVVAEHIERVTEHFDDLTVANGWEHPLRVDREWGPWLVTHRQLEDLYEQWPYARAWIKRNAKKLRLTVETPSGHGSVTETSEQTGRE